MKKGLTDVPSSPAIYANICICICVVYIYIYICACGVQLLATTFWAPLRNKPEPKQSILMVVHSKKPMPNKRSADRPGRCSERTGRATGDNAKAQRHSGQGLAWPNRASRLKVFPNDVRSRLRIETCETNVECTSAVVTGCSTFSPNAI